MRRTGNNWQDITGKAWDIISLANITAHGVKIVVISLYTTNPTVGFVEVEFYGTEHSDQIAIADASCSSEYYSSGVIYRCHNAYDGDLTVESGEWATNSEQIGAWIELLLPGSDPGSDCHNVNIICIMQRVASSESIKGVKFIFDDDIITEVSLTYN